jgi:hypothetical protein
MIRILLPLSLQNESLFRRGKPFPSQQGLFPVPAGSLEEDPALHKIALGQTEIVPDPDEEQLQMIAAALKMPGFELINNETDKTVESIKNAVIEFVHHSDLSELHTSYSDLIANRAGRDYPHLSRLFSNSQDTTIERFIIE